MRVQVRLFAAARELSGSSELEVDLAEGAVVDDLRAAVAATDPRLAQLVERSLFAVNSEYAQGETPIAATDELALIPPVSGG